MESLQGIARRGSSRPDPVHGAAASRRGTFGLCPWRGRILWKIVCGGAGVPRSRPETSFSWKRRWNGFPSKGHFSTGGQGSGCIAATLVLECPTARGFALEASPRAVVTAWHNFRRHGLLPAVTLLHSSTCDALPSACMDMVLGNPPYIRRLESLIS
jgi:hypothetical protein